MTAHWRTWKPVKANLHLPGLREMVATSKVGECPFCGEPAKRRSMSKWMVAKRQKTGQSDYFLICGEPECRTAYHRCHNRDRYGYARPFKKTKNQRGIRKYTKHLSDLSARQAA